jgi:hypothetical protein
MHVRVYNARYITDMGDRFFSAGDWGFSGLEADGNRLRWLRHSE